MIMRNNNNNNNILQALGSGLALTSCDLTTRASLICISKASPRRASSTASTPRLSFDSWTRASLLNRNSVFIASRCGIFKKERRKKRKKKKEKKKSERERLNTYLFFKSRMPKCECGLCGPRANLTFDASSSSGLGCKTRLGARDCCFGTLLRA